MCEITQLHNYCVRTFTQNCEILIRKGKYYCDCNAHAILDLNNSYYTTLSIH